jgi:glyceraldehyde 3-phosphate dehydrogenase
MDPAFADIEVVGINDLTDIKTMGHLLKYDSVMGTFAGEVQVEENTLVVDAKTVPVTGHRQPKDIPWAEMGAEYVLECTGIFRDEDSAKAHIDAGAAKVIISAPAKGDIKTIVMGVNEDEYDPTMHHVVSNASCTTNCLAPVAQVILNSFGIKRGLMTTIHAYTGDQRLLDFPHSDLRRARAAAMSMIPTGTGAAAAVALVIPELKNKFDGLAVRVPTPNVSLVDAVMEVEKETTVPEVNRALREAANRFLRYTEEPLVSIDLGKTVKVMSWYDNEWGYSNRMLDLVLHMEANKLL